jgi:hypothetical protein
MVAAAKYLLKSCMLHHSRLIGSSVNEKASQKSGITLAHLIHSLSLSNTGKD